MRNCAFSYTDGSGTDGCNGCLPGYVMDNFYTCSLANGGADSNCLVHGFRRNDNNKTIGCIQCNFGFYIDAFGRCSAMPTNLTGCNTPTQDLQGCLWCDGFFGYYESNADQFGRKICSPGGTNYYQKARDAGYVNNAAIYRFAFVGLLVAVFYNFI
jgi:hypothetical protein